MAKKKKLKPFFWEEKLKPLIFMENCLFFSLFIYLFNKILEIWQIVLILILYFHLFLEACNLHVQIFRVEKTLRSDLERIRYMFLNHINKLKFNSKCKWQK